MDDRDQQRVARNEALFRKVNEGIAAGQWPGEEEAPIGFRCECASLGCNQLIEVLGPAYERVRDNPRRFVIAPGHQVAEAEVVVESYPGYSVVEKLGEAGRVAALEDPRD